MEATGRRGITRGDMLKLSALGGAALLVPFRRTAQARLEAPTIPEFEPYKAILPVSPVLKPVESTATTDFYEVTMKRGEAEIIPGVKTPIWGYNGIYPGPSIEARSGREVVVRQTNELTVPTSIHTHGAYVDGDSDGHPKDLIQPGGSKEYIFGNNQNARMQWYHDHAMHITATNVYMGLSGIYTISDDIDDNLPLPHGEHDITLVIQDRMFNDDGTLHYPADAVSNAGFEGNVNVVNGVAQPRLEVARRKYLFCVLNGSNARPYVLALSSGRPFTVVASEGGMFQNPVTTTRLPIAPAERYEIVVDFSGYELGEKVVLENARVRTRNPTREIMRFDVVRDARDDSIIPDVLRPEEFQYDDTHLPPEMNNVAREREFRFDKDGSMFTINGLTFDEDRIDADPEEGDTEIWKVYNNSGGWIHPVHVHLVNFKILSRADANGSDRRPPHPWERGWKDTVWVGEGEEVRIAMRWPKVPVHEEPGDFAYRYVFHCHNLEHEDHDMMAQIGVGESEVAVVTVTADPAPGPVEENQQVRLDASDSKAKIYYTTDGSAPTLGSTEYAGEEIVVDRSMTIKAIGVDEIGYRGPVASFAYKISTPPAITGLSLRTGHSLLTFGGGTVLTGRLISGGRAVAGKRVTLLHRPIGAASYTRVPGQPSAGVLTNANGFYRLAGVKPSKNTLYRARFGGGPEHQLSYSPIRRVNVKAVITNATPTQNLKLGNSRAILGLVKPGHTGPVKVTIKRGTRIVATRNVALRGSRYRVMYRPPAPGIYTVQAFTAPHADHFVGASPIKKLRVVR